MSIYTKIEEIRRKPEEIRMRYVLGSVFVSMCIISVLWIFSLTASFQKQQESAPQASEPTKQTDQGAPNANTSPSDMAPSLNEWIKK